ncbi:MAG TPA: hypothetical protein VKA21_07260 [Candidatus Binatia bacterium]|nr:hypothetical protein [Candidatus Binatia bacterium]
MRTPLVVALLALLATSASAAGFRVLTVGKVARFENRGDPNENGGTISVGRDRELATLHDPRCPTTSKVEIEAYLQSTYRVRVLLSVALDCARWQERRGGWVYEDPTGPVRAIRYASRGLRIEVKGPGFEPIGGPVGFVQGQLAIGDQLLRARVHNFRRNDGRRVVSRKPSSSGAAGEAGFWEVLSGEDDSDATEDATIRRLEKAARRDAKDGRSRFLLAMLHLYRFAQQVTDFRAPSEAARAEIRTANGWFAKALPLLWNESAGAGDSRVPGFAAAAKYAQGVVDGDPTLRDAGLADLERAVAVNAFFNVFDYIPVVQIAAPGDPLFQQAFSKVTSYLTDPETLGCVADQPEICFNAGFAPHNIQGSLILFGDVYAKGGVLADAQRWYRLASFFPDTRTWRFKAISDDRVANAAARVALYQDGDPSNDPPVIGMGPEACAVCHTR